MLDDKLLRAYAKQHRNKLEQLLAQSVEEDRIVVIGDEDISFREYHSDCTAFFAILLNGDNNGSQDKKA